jgi:hypothetical protein
MKIDKFNRGKFIPTKCRECGELKPAPSFSISKKDICNLCQKKHLKKETDSINRRREVEFKIDIKNISEDYPTLKDIMSV